MCTHSCRSILKFFTRVRKCTAAQLCTLESTQPAGYLAIAGSLFSTSKRLLVENNTVPETLRTTHHRLAQKMGTKLGQQLLTTRFPPTKRVPSNAAQWCQRGLPGLGYNVYRPSLRAARQNSLRIPHCVPHRMSVPASDIAKWYSDYSPGWYW